MDHDLQDRIDAYAAGLWTPEIVGLRMIEAYGVLARVPMRWKPSGPRSLWPAYFFEVEDIADGAERSDYIASMRKQFFEETFGDAAKQTPTAEEVSRADEALAWPIDHLAALPLHADALMLWATCIGTGINMGAKLAARNKRAKALAESMTLKQNAARAEKRATIAVEVARWANRKLATARREAEGEVLAKRCQNIKANAQNRFESAITAANAWNTEVLPREAMPGKVREPQTMTKYRKLACAVVCDALLAANIVVRYPDIEAPRS